MRGPGTTCKCRRQPSLSLPVSMNTFLFKHIYLNTYLSQELKGGLHQNELHSLERLFTSFLDQDLFAFRLALIVYLLSIQSRKDKLGQILTMAIHNSWFSPGLV